MPRSAHAAAMRSTSGPGTSTELSHMRSHSSSKPPKRAAWCAQAPDGYTETNAWAFLQGVVAPLPCEGVSTSARTFCWTLFERMSGHAIVTRGVNGKPLKQYSPALPFVMFAFVIPFDPDKTCPNDEIDAYA